MGAVLAITGYLDRPSHRPGETFIGHVSTLRSGPCRVRLARMQDETSNPAFEDLARIYDHRFTGDPQPVRLGSHAVAPSPSRNPCAACTWSVLIWCARAGKPQAILCDADTDADVVITAGAEGVAARLSWPGGGCRLQTFKPLVPHCWHRVWLAADPATGRVRLGQAAFDDNPAGIADARIHGQTMRLPGGAGIFPASATILFAAERAGEPTNHFDGKLEAPAILAGFLEAWSDPAEILAQWDFSRGIDSIRIEDIGPRALHGHLVNMPTRAVVGAGWTGREMCWRHAPGEYAAILFDAGDLDDCRWLADFAWTVPRGLRGGAYAMRLTREDDEGGEEWLPLYVLPPRRGPFARAAFLAPTFTYQAHADGAGLHFSNRLRPIPAMRHHAADARILGWLAARGIRHDVITDEDLDDEGPALLAPYRCVLTGARPECQTERTLDALTLHIRGGGRLAYVGGHGFTRRVARRPDIPHLIELRHAEPGECHHQLDGQYGGLWSDNRRPPQQLVGVGFSGRGHAGSAGYRRTAASHAPAHAWIFAGIEDEVIGDHSLFDGGAAEFGTDHADFSLGTPAHAVVLARADAVDADMVYFDTPSGGAVFAAGSVAFSGGLWRDGAFDGPVSRLLENVVRRFMA